MHYHIKAWYDILNGFGANLSMERVQEECYGKNDELLERIFPGRFTEEEKEQMSIEKEKSYQTAFKPHLKLIDGLGDFLKEHHERGIKMAIASAAIMFNINYVIDGLNIRKYFDALVSADEVKQSKPHPQTFLMAAELLGIAPGECLVFEDNPKGVEAAANAGMDVVVITTMHQSDEFGQFYNIIAFAPDYNNIPADKR